MNTNTMNTQTAIVCLGIIIAGVEIVKYGMDNGCIPSISYGKDGLSFSLVKEPSANIEETNQVNIT